MIKIKHNYRVYLDQRSAAITIRVRWENKTHELHFSIGLKWSPEKWNNTTQRPKLNTTYNGFSYREACEKIELWLSYLDEEFANYEIKSEVPSKDEMRDAITSRVNGTTTKKDKTWDEHFENFLNDRSNEKNWKPDSHYKYLSVWDNIREACPEAFTSGFTKATLQKLKDWYISEGYKNVTINRKYKSIKAILVYGKENGALVSDDAIKFNPNLKSLPKTVTYLTHDELMNFYNFKFKSTRLERIRDMWAFMAFTSLRFSDMQNLCWDNVFDDHIDIVIQKTATFKEIPLTENAREILQKYRSKSATGKVFNTISNEKFNDYVKEAAKEASLNREIIEKTICGTSVTTKRSKFYEIISAHDARRTFVCCSIAMGIPPNVVMACTGHSDYKAMRPYIDISNTTKRVELAKWDNKEDSQQPAQPATETQSDDLISFLKDLSPEQRDAMMNMVKMFKK